MQTQLDELMKLLDEVYEDINELQRTHNNEVMRWFLQRIMLKIKARLRKLGNM
jgi:hypothetical protein